jgi:hypothetical protein
MARYGGEDITEEMMQHFVRSMEMEREERGGQATLQYLKETGDIEAELGRVGEVAKTAKQKTVQVATEARGAADKKLLDWTIGLASLALMAYGGGALGLGGKGLKAFHALMKGSKTARAATVAAGSLFAGGKAQQAGREYTQKRAGEIPIAQFREPGGEAIQDKRLAARRDAGEVETSTRTLRSMMEEAYTPTGRALGMEVGPESVAYARQIGYPILALLGAMDFAKGIGSGGGTMLQEDHGWRFG